MQNTMNKQEMQLTVADGTVLTFRFDMGTTRIIKELTGKDPMKGAFTEDWWEYSCTVFTASYLRACKVYKTLPGYTVEGLQEVFEELDMNTAVKFIKNFNAVMTVEATPDVIEAVKQAEKLEETQKGKVLFPEGGKSAMEEVREAEIKQLDPNQ